MERVIQSNIYSDFFYMLFGVIGATIYYMKGSYILGSIIILICFLYLMFENFYYLLTLALLVFSILLIYWFSSLLLFKKNMYTKILTFAYIIILFSGIDYYVLKFLGISFINIDATSIKIGAFSEMIILSIAVLYRMKVLKDKNRFMKTEIIKYSKEIIELTLSSKVEGIQDNRDSLSLREREIFDHIVLGKPNKEIANVLNISVNTVKFHIKNIYDKLHIKNRKEAVNLEKTLRETL